MEYIRLWDQKVFTAAEVQSLLNEINDPAFRLEENGYALIHPASPPPQEPGFVVEAAPPVEVDGKWYYGWTQRLMSETEQVAAQQALIARYSAELDKFLDQTAQGDRWDNRLTCIARAGYPNPWQQRAIAFGIWMDTCYALAYQILGEVLAEQRPLPTLDELLGEMPPLVWPE